MKFQVKRSSKFPHECPLKGTKAEVIKGREVYTIEFKDLEEFIAWAQEILKGEKFERIYDLPGIILGYSVVTDLMTLEIYDSYIE